MCEAYDYDAAGQLVARREGSGGVGTCGTAGVAESAAYDGHGNRVEHSVGSVTSTAMVNRADQVVVVDAEVGGVDVVYGYDLAGRRTLSDPQGSDAQTVYGWGANGQITSVVDHDGVSETTSTVGYDAEGRMRDITVDTGAATVHNVLLWDPTQGVPQIVDALVEGVHHRQNYGLRRISSYGDWYSYDWQTSAVESTDYPDHPGSYSPWGQPDSDHTGFGYRGELHIGDLIHLRNRNYDPSTGTFLSPDPLDGIDGEPTVANPYHYADNDPLNRVDWASPQTVEASTMRRNHGRDTTA
ncbi:MAG: hypothetical protein IT195_00025, partial [Microthrixaceae bacterium]|nr:hypothetical protein [Microthrixaceae bacterium]